MRKRHAVKDKDLYTDCGRRKEYKDLSNPPRDDIRKRYKKDDISPEDKADYKDTLFDPDLKTSGKLSAMDKRAGRDLSAQLYRIAVCLEGFIND